MKPISSRKRPTYPLETRAWAVAESRTGVSRQGDIARSIGCTTRQLRRWLRQADIEEGRRQGVKIRERQEIHQLKTTIRRQAEQIRLLEAAQDFFAQETR